MSHGPTARLMPIGRLARLSRLSVRLLRRYSDDGLLPPAWVDPQSGYRYYRPEQVRAAATIALLRSLGVPLAGVRDILGAADEVALGALLRAEQARAEEELRARAQALAGLERLVRTPPAIHYDVAVSDRPVRRLAVLTGAVSVEDLGPGTARLCDAVSERLASAGVGAGEALVAIFPLDLTDTVTVAVGASLPAHRPLPDGLTEWSLPGGAWAGTVHVGPYDALALAYAALFERLAELGHDALGPVEETYLTPSPSTPPEEIVTRLAVPVSRT